MAVKRKFDLDNDDVGPTVSPFLLLAPSFFSDPWAECQAIEACAFPQLRPRHGRSYG
jgi:hypothetical protein